MASPSVRIQVCGQIAVEVAGVRRESELPGQQGRRLFAFLVVRRGDGLTRDILVDALWGANPPNASQAAVHALLSKLRRVIPCRSAQGLLRLDLPADAWVDLDAARDAIHRAESANAQLDWARAWGAAQTALFTARRGFLPGDESAWAQVVRTELDLLRQRALEAYAAAALGIGHAELATAERASRELVLRSPFRESGYRLLMSALNDQGNTAEALQVYDTLRLLLRDELGVIPSQPTRELHTRLLDTRPAH
jgi:SARP family transcriptional regulator, regulator of embCAB operon